MVKTMHPAMTDASREGRFPLRLHGDEGADPVLGRLAASGFHDELRGYF
jgi:hypothetical protein